MLKSRIVATTAALIAAASINAAHAASCESHARGCMGSQGHSPGARSVCFGPSYQNCKKTGQYVGPYTGKVFQTDGKSSK